METEVCKYEKPSQNIHFIPNGGERISEHLLHVQNVVIPQVVEASKSLRTEEWRCGSGNLNLNLETVEQKREMADR